MCLAGHSRVCILWGARVPDLVVLVVEVMYTGGTCYGGVGDITLVFITMSSFLDLLPEALNMMR